jgi:hypothetical protein
MIGVPPFVSVSSVLEPFVRPGFWRHTNAIVD